MSHRTLSFVLGLLLASGVYATMPPNEINLQASVGNVSFGHQEHVNNLGAKCTVCHHTHKGTGPVQSCHTCHQKTAMGTIPSSQDAFHKNCQECHTGEANADPKEPMGQCKFCHQMK